MTDSSCNHGGGDQCIACAYYTIDGEKVYYNDLENFGASSESELMFIAHIQKHRVIAFFQNGKMYIPSRQGHSVPLAIGLQWEAWQARQLEIDKLTKENAELKAELKKEGRSVKLNWVHKERKLDLTKLNGNLSEEYFEALQFAFSHAAGNICVEGEEPEGNGVTDLQNDQILDAHAQVGGGVFRKGVKWETVIKASQRYYTYQQNKPEFEPVVKPKELLKIAAGELLILPKAPSMACLISMVSRHRHDFGILDEEIQKNVISSMRQLYEEATGQGFYKTGNKQ